MRFVVDEVRPGPDIRKAETLPKAGRFLGRKRVLTVMPDQVALVADDGLTTLHAPAGKTPQVVEVGKGAHALIFQNEMELKFRVEDVRFSGAAKGRVRMWGKFLVPVEAGAPGRGHPIARSWEGGLDAGSLCRVLARGLAAAAGPVTSRRLEALEYSPGMATSQLSSDVTALFKSQEVMNALSNEAGLVPVSQVEILEIGSPELDDIAESRRRAAVEAEKRRIAIGEIIAQMSGDMVMDGAMHRRDMVQQQAENAKIIEQKKAELLQEHHELEKAKVKAASSIQDELAREALREEKARVDAAEAEAALKRYEAEGKKQEAERKRLEVEQSQLALEEARLQVEYLRRELARAHEADAKLDVIRHELETLRETGQPSRERQLGLVAVWRAHNDGGIFIPQLGLTESLPSGTMLDVEVSVTREAYVYILLKSSTDEWQFLVPEAEDERGDRRLGIGRGNLQRAGEIVCWPGTNRLRPDLPFWQLDRATGTERLAVIASLRPLEIERTVKEGGIEGVRRMSGRISVRGFCNPAAGSDRPFGEQPHACDYHRVITAIRGEDVVLRETVISHT